MKRYFKNQIKKKSVKKLTKYQKNFLLKEISKSMGEGYILKLENMCVQNYSSIEGYYISITFYEEPDTNPFHDPLYRLDIYNSGKLNFEEIINRSPNPEKEEINSFHSVKFNPLIIYRALNTLGFKYSI